MKRENGKTIDKKDTRKYYSAYDERYKTVHERGVRWSSNVCTPIVMEIINRCSINKNHNLLEIGCGEGRDSRILLEEGFNLLATDISKEAINYCKKTFSDYENCFSVLDCLSDSLDVKYDFIFGISVIHMLVVDEDRRGFYKFIYDHLCDDGFALICTMGDGITEMKSDINTAFDLQERNHESGKITVAATSCRMVSFPTFLDEIENANLKVVEKGITSSLPDFNNLMYAVVRKNSF